jgi:putative DNA primase/helicase
LRRQLTSNPTIVAVERLARCDERLVRSADDADKEPLAINTPGGVVDLRTGEMRPHGASRGDELHTRSTSVAPSPPDVPLSKACRRFLQYMDEVTAGDQELVRYMQMAAGYTLTGLTSEQCLFFLAGDGSNGKSVFSGIISKAMGTYHRAAEITTFTENKMERHSTEIAALRGAVLSPRAKPKKASGGMRAKSRRSRAAM